jgi:hypothetical protein
MHTFVMKSYACGILKATCRSQICMYLGILPVITDTCFAGYACRKWIPSLKCSDHISRYSQTVQCVPSMPTRREFVNITLHSGMSILYSCNIVTPPNISGCYSRSGYIYVYIINGSKLDSCWEQKWSVINLYLCVSFYNCSFSAIKSNVSVEWVGLLLHTERYWVRISAAVWLRFFMGFLSPNKFRDISPI